LKIPPEAGVRGKHPAFIRHPTLIIAFILFVSVLAVDGGPWTADIFLKFPLPFPIFELYFY
jgi:hypothetical protein